MPYALLDVIRVTFDGEPPFGHSFFRAVIPRDINVKERTKNLSFKKNDPVQDIIQPGAVTAE